MPELGPYGSVRGAAGNSRPYRECQPLAKRPKVWEETAIWDRWGCGNLLGI
jgi:hypothetical protein